MISGFLTLYTDQGKSITRGLVHKFLRIYPMATIACFFTLLIKSIASDNLNVLWNLKALAANFLLIFRGWPFFEMTGYNNPTWYLCILIQCYLLFYLLNAFARWFGIPKFLLFFGIIILAIGLNYFHLISYYSYRGTEAFFIGAELCETRELIPERKWEAVTLLILSAILTVLVPSQQRLILVFAVFPLLIILGFWWKGNQAEWIRLLGKTTFEVYLWHYPLMATEQMITRITTLEIRRTYLTMVAFTILVWLLSIGMYKLVETPVYRRFSRERRAKETLI